MSFKPLTLGEEGLPLGSVDAVVFDTETTGLSTGKDRIVELGAVRISTGRILDGRKFGQLVNPGLPMPDAALRVHRITDSDVSDAPAFDEAFSSFSEWAGPSLFAGYSIHFDLAVLEAEHARNGMLWLAPRFLDVQQLVQALNPDLPDWSLETVAAWCGVEVENRHRALADAETAARVFLKLIPKLRAANIATFSEAERACRKISARSEGIPYGGVADPASTANFDSFPFRNRVGTVMKSPPEVIAVETTMREAIATMVERRIGSLYVQPEGGSGYGILTERDVLRAINSDGDCLGHTVGRHCSRPVKTVAPKEFLYRAMIKMSLGGYRHLGVMNPEGELIGSLSVRDLIRDRSGGAAALGFEIESADSVSALGRVWSGLSAAADALVRESVEARSIAAIISRELRAMTSRACEFAEAELEASDGTRPPARYAMLVLGSGGRGESLLAMDQDNAIVFEEGVPGSEIDMYFERLGRRVADILDEAGVKRCSGGVMASNSAWRKNEAEWRQQVKSWLNRTRPEDILHADIFFDGMAVHGDARLAERLRADSLEAARSSRPFLRLLATRAADFRLPFGLFGNWRLSGDRVDLKRNGLMPVFSAARAAALQHGVAARSTKGRLESLRKLNAVPNQAIDRLLVTQEVILETILKQQLTDIVTGVAPSSHVAPRQLDRAARRRLEWALKQLDSVKDLLGVPAGM